MATLETLPDKDSFKATEACRLAEVAPYVLRYWESEFPALSAGKEKGVQRTYTRRDLLVISRIRELLYDEGFTIAGAKKKLDAEIREGRFDGVHGRVEKHAGRPAGAAPSRAPASAARREERIPAPDKKSTPASADKKPAATTFAPAEGPIDRKRLVRELKEIVAMLDGKKRS